MRDDPSLPTLASAVHGAARWIEPLETELRQVVVGREELLETLLIALLVGEHVLVESGPGQGKATVLESLAATIGARYRRAPLTSETVPSDICAFCLESRTAERAQAETQAEPTRLLLAQDLDLAPSHARWTLLEAMDAGRIRIGRRLHAFERPFLVMASVDPANRDGASALTRAERERFLLSVRLDHPSRDEEREIVDVATPSAHPPRVRPMAGISQITRAQKVVQAIAVTDEVKNYAVSLVRATRDARVLGASPRASVGLIGAARAHAFLQQRAYAVPEDVREVAPRVLRHRLAPAERGRAAGREIEDLVQRLLQEVACPASLASRNAQPRPGG